MMCRIFLSLLILTATGGVSAAIGGSLLADAAGVWRGSGWYRKNSADQKRATKCALKLTYFQDSNSLSISGKCAVGGRSAKVSGRLVEKSEREYSGQWRTIDSTSPGSMSGRRTGDRIQFTWRAKSESSQEVETYSAQWTITPNRITITSTIGAGGKTQLSSLVLKQ